MNAWAIALDSIWHHKLRSTLTALGVVIGVFAVVTLTSLGSGVNSYVTNQFNRIGATLITVVPAAPGTQAKFNAASSGSAGHGPRRGGGFGGGFAQVPSTLTVADAIAIAGLQADHIAAVAPVAQVAAIVAHGSIATAANPVVGTTSAYFSLQRLAFLAGGAPGGFTSGVVLGHSAARTLFGGSVRTAVGGSVSINGKSFRVVGVLKAAGQSFGTDPDQAVYIPIQEALALAGTRHLTEIVVGAESTGTVKAASAAVQRLLGQRHPIKDFAVITSGQMLSIIQSTLSVITAVLGGIAAISLVVGGIGIMNIMLVTVTERVREIGVRKALGAGDGDILVQFLVESVLLAVLGGAIGLLCAGVTSHIVGRAINVPIGLTGTSVGAALGFSVLVGAVFGVLPAMNAARLMPAAALRSE